MTPRPTIAPGQVWRRPNGLHVLVTHVDQYGASIIPVARLGAGWVRDYGSDPGVKPLRIIGGRGWELVAESVADPRESQPARPAERGCLMGEIQDFGWALRQLKDGKKVARQGWNGKNMWLAFMPGFVIPAGMVNGRTAKYVPPSQDINCGGYIAMWTATGVWQPGWLASQPDMLSEDWCVVE